MCIWRVTTRESGGVHGTRKGASGRHTEGAFVRDFSRTRLGGFARVGRTCGIRGSDMWHVTFGMARERHGGWSMMVDVSGDLLRGVYMCVYDLVRTRACVCVCAMCIEVLVVVSPKGALRAAGETDQDGH